MVKINKFTKTTIKDYTQCFNIMEFSTEYIVDGIMVKLEP